MKDNKLKWKDVYNKNKSRRFNEIVEIMDLQKTISSTPFKLIIKNKFIVGSIGVLISLLLLLTFYKHLNVFFIVIVFLICMSILIIITNTFVIKCSKNSLLLKFGFQKSEIPYEKVKSIYLTKSSDYSFGFPIKDYNIIIRYEDNNNTLRELSFSTHFLKPKEIDEFLENFTIENNNSEEFVIYEKKKILKTVLKTTIIVLLFIYFIISVLT